MENIPDSWLEFHTNPSARTSPAIMGHVSRLSPMLPEMEEA